MRIILLYKIFTILVLLLIISCREDIIEPNNPAGNKNIPLREDKENYFNIALNADRLSTEMIFDTNFSSENNSLFLVVNDKQSGNFALRILSSENKVLYSAEIEIGDINISQRINRGVPGKVKITFNNFTGKVKIVISKSSF